MLFSSKIVSAMAILATLPKDGIFFPPVHAASTGSLRGYDQDLIIASGDNNQKLSYTDSLDADYARDRNFARDGGSNFDSSSGVPDSTNGDDRKLFCEKDSEGWHCRQLKTCIQTPLGIRCTRDRNLADSS